MEVAKAPSAVHKTNLYNTVFETGVRTLVVLEALYPRPCSLTDLTWFDHLVVHTGDVGGPESLHPDLDSSVGELLVRRRLIDNGLKLLQKLHLVDVRYAEGVTYLPGEEAPSFLNMLSANYNIRLKICANWLANEYGELSSEQIANLFEDRVVSWTSRLSGLAASQ